MRNPFPHAGQSEFKLSDERAEKLRREFDEIDANRDKMLSFKEVHGFLSRRTGRVFDRELCQELFAKMDKNSDDVVTVDEFIRALVDAEDMIKSRIEVLQKQIKESQEHLDESKKQLYDAESSEELNEFGIMKGSQLTVQVVEGKNLKSVGLTGASNPYVTLTCDQQKIETARLRKTVAPQWNEAFTFTIPKGNIDLKAVVQSEGLLSSDFQGQVSVPLTLVKDQMRHDAWFELHGPKGNELWQGSLHLSIQWIWSRRKYLADIVQQWEDNISLDRQETDHLSQQLKKLDEPFGMVDTVQSTLPTKSSQQMTAVEMLIDEKVIEFTDQTLGSDFNWDFAMLVSVGVVLVLSSLNMFIRPDFPNVMLGVVSYYCYTAKMADSHHYKFLSLAILLLSLYDFVWYSTQELPMIEKSLWTFCTWTSGLLSVAKLAVLLVFWKHAVELRRR